MDGEGTGAAIAKLGIACRAIWPIGNGGEGLGLLENWLGCTLPESRQEGGLSVGAVGPQGASRWRDDPRRSARARSFAP